jgi:hypothetical protein
MIHVLAGPAELSTLDVVDATCLELKSKDVEFTLDLIRHSYGKGSGDL